MRRLLLILLIPAAFLLGQRTGRDSQKGIESGLAVVDRDYYGEALSLIAGAERSISLLMFELFRYPEYPDSKTNRLLAELVSASRRGVDVNICIEGGEEYLGDDFLEKQRASAVYLLESGVDVRMDRKGTTSHAKLLLVDGRSVLLGSTNWTHYAMERNVETNVLIESTPLASSFEEYFNRIWEAASPVKESASTGDQPEGTSSIALLLSAPENWDGKQVEIVGEVDDFKRRRSRKGNLYSTFYVADGEGYRVKIFSWGHPEIADGDRVAVSGVFRETKKVGGLDFHNEVEADQVVRR